MSTISNELFLLNELEKKYSTHISYLKDISYNPTGKRDFIEIDFKSLHFDKVPAFYSDNYENSQSNSSFDLFDVSLKSLNPSIPMDFKVFIRYFWLSF